MPLSIANDCTGMALYGGPEVQITKRIEKHHNKSKNTTANMKLQRQKQKPQPQIKKTQQQIRND